MAIDTAMLAFPKSRPRILDRIQRKLDLEQQMRVCRKAVQARDKGLCRACGRRGTEMHHLQKRSQGGTWQTHNIVLLCLTCHRFEHAALLHLSGNADGLLTVTAQGPALPHLRSGQPRLRKRST